MVDEDGDFQRPYIVKNLENLTGNSGHAVTFYCEAAGNPTPSFRWYVVKSLRVKVDNNLYVTVSLKISSKT